MQLKSDRSAPLPFLPILIPLLPVQKQACVASWAFDITQKFKIRPAEIIDQVLPNPTCTDEVPNCIDWGRTWLVGDKSQFPKITSFSALCQFNFLCWVVLNFKKMHRIFNLKLLEGSTEVLEVLHQIIG